MGKKIVLFSIGAMFSCLVFVACLSTNKTVEVGRYDYSTPVENDAVLIIGGQTGCWITEFDGETVSWSPYYQSGFLTNKVLPYQISVPSGTHSIKGGIPGQSGTILYQSTTKFNFEAGKAYQIDVYSRNFKITETVVPENIIRN